MRTDRARARCSSASPGSCGPTRAAPRSTARSRRSSKLGAGFHPELSGRENVYLNGSILGLSKKEIDSKFDAIVDFAGLERFIDTPVKNYSSGMYVRLGFSVAINVDPDVLLVDEILAVGDENFQRKCAEKFAELREEGKTIVVCQPRARYRCARCATKSRCWNTACCRQVGPAAEVIDDYIADDARRRRRRRHWRQALGFGRRSGRARRVDRADGRGRAVAVTGEPLTLRHHYATTEPIERPCFGMSITTIEGVVVAASTTREIGFVPDKIDGTGYIDLVIPRLPLLPGPTTSPLAVRLHRVASFDYRRTRCVSTSNTVSGSASGRAHRASMRTGRCTTAPNAHDRRRSSSSPTIRWAPAWPAPRSARSGSPAALARRGPRRHAVHHRHVRTRRRRYRPPRWTAELHGRARPGATSSSSRVRIDGQPWLAKTDKVMVVDLYDPFHLEQLELSSEVAEHDVRVEVVASTVAVLNEQIARGDFFLCASEKQRDFWLGALGALGRINPPTYDADKSLRSLIDVVPFGVDDEPPARRGTPFAASSTGIAADDEVLLWGGGVYNWFDPLTLIRAVHDWRSAGRSCASYFLGMKHPNPEVPQMRMATAPMALADELGLTGSHVFFNHDWVPLRAARRLAARRRHRREHAPRSRRDRLLLPHPRARLPLGRVADRVHRGRRHGRPRGRTSSRRGVPPGDPAALAAAFETLLGDDGRRKEAAAAVADIAPGFAWSTALAPLVAFCHAPRRAPDLVDRETARRLQTVGRTAARQRRGPRHAWASLRRHARHGRARQAVTMGLRRVAGRPAYAESSNEVSRHHPGVQRRGVRRRRRRRRSRGAADARRARR